MKKPTKILALLMVLALLISPLSTGAAAINPGGTTYYVDSAGGSDTNSGISEENAWQTLAKVGEKTFLPGDSILLKRGGVYTGPVSLKGSGAAGNPIIFSAYGEGDKPLLTSTQANDLITMFDVSYWTLDGLEITAPNGGGIWIDTLTQESNGIILTNLTVHNIQNYPGSGRDNLSAGAAAARAGVMIKGLPARSRFAVNNLTVTDCDFYDCANGISIWGSWNDAQNPWVSDVSEVDPVYNTGILVENTSFTDFDAEAIIVGMCDGAVVRNCPAINCCQGGATGGYANAAMWFWGSENSVIENCEIAGQKCLGDGMSIDFDSYTNNSMYQYIYSHDNIRFMGNCPIYNGQVNNTVRYCLSVNDNVRKSTGGGSSGERYFKFYNNTIVNGSSFSFYNNDHSIIQNNIFSLVPGCTLDFDIKKNYTLGSNCYYSTVKPLRDFKSIHANPQFAGTDYTDKNSFVLKACSPCIGTGTQVEEDMGAHDLYGNPLTGTHNIGCYEGPGVAGSFTNENPVALMVRVFTGIYRFMSDLIEHDWNWILEQIEKLKA